jgi:hypothetical protein
LPAMISQYFIWAGFCLFCSSHDKDKMILSGHETAPRNSFALIAHFVLSCTRFRSSTDTASAHTLLGLLLREKGRALWMDIAEGRVREAREGPRFRRL